MKTETIITVALTASEGKALVKVAQDEYGEYELDGKRYNVHSGEKIYTSEIDVENWQEADSLASFLKENGYQKIEAE
jgi:hypothetical protein